MGAAGLQCRWGQQGRSYSNTYGYEYSYAAVWARVRFTVWARVRFTVTLQSGLELGSQTMVTLQSGLELGSQSGQGQGRDQSQGEGSR